MSSCTVTAGDVTIPLACSVGLALAECDANTDPMELVRQADAAMYEAKKTARATGDSTARLHVAGGASVT
jgi:GGDEF domain-containing protein